MMLLVLYCICVAPIPVSIYLCLLAVINDAISFSIINIKAVRLFRAMHDVKINGVSYYTVGTFNIVLFHHAA